MSAQEFVDGGVAAAAADPRVEGEEEDANDGCRDNSTYTIARVNPVGYNPKAVTVNPETNEIVLFDFYNNKPKSWVLDFAVDDVLHVFPDGTTQVKDISPDNYGSQEDVWNIVQEVVDERLVLDSECLGLLSLGGRGSGKTYSLFGKQKSAVEMGVLPRLLRYLLDDADSPVSASMIWLQMFLVHEEECIDLLHPTCERHKCEDSLAYSHALGAVVLSMTTLACTNADDAIYHLELGLRIGGIMQSNVSDYLTSTNMVVSLRILSADGKRINRIIASEVAPTIVPNLVSTQIDRFSGAARTYISSRILRDSVVEYPKLASKQKSAKHKKHNDAAMEQENLFFKPDDDVRYYEKSALTYILQDPLYRKPACVCVGNMRGTASAFEDNASTVDFMNRLDLMNEEPKRVKSAGTTSDVMARLDVEIGRCRRRCEDLWSEHYLHASKSADKTPDLSRQQSLELQAKAGGTASMNNSIDASEEEEKITLFDPVKAATLTDMYSKKALLLHKKAEYLDKMLQSLMLATATIAEEHSRLAVHVPTDDDVDPVQGAAANESMKKIFNMFNFVTVIVERVNDAALGGGDVAWGSPRSSAASPRRSMGAASPRRSLRGSAGGPSSPRRSMGTGAAQPRSSLSPRRSMGNASRRSNASSIPPLRLIEEKQVHVSDIAEQWLISRGVMMEKEMRVHVQYQEDEAKKIAELLSTQGSPVGSLGPSQKNSRAGSILQPISGGSVFSRESTPQMAGSGAMAAKRLPAVDPNQPYLTPVYPGSSSSGDHCRIYLHRGHTIIRATEDPLTSQGRKASPTAPGNGGLISMPTNDEIAQEKRFLKAAVELLGSILTPEELGDTQNGALDSARVGFDNPIDALEDKSARSGVSGASRATARASNPLTLIQHSIELDLSAAWSLTEEYLKKARVKSMQLNGLNLEPLHCRFTLVGGLNVRIYPSFTDRGSGVAYVRVNGQAITHETILHHGDYIQLGLSRFFRVNIPMMEEEEESIPDESPAEGSEASVQDENDDDDDEKNAKKKAHNAALALGKYELEPDNYDSLTGWEQCMLSSFGQQFCRLLSECEVTRRVTSQLDVDRELSTIESTYAHSLRIQTFELTDAEEKKLKDDIPFAKRAQLCELIGSVSFISALADIMKRNVTVKVIFSKVQSSQRAQYLGKVFRMESLVDRAENLDPNQVLKNLVSKQPSSARGNLGTRQRSNRRKGLSSTEEVFFGAMVVVKAKTHEGHWFWTPEVFQERFTMLRNVHAVFVSPQIERNSFQLDKFCPAYVNPYADVTEDELIGAGFLYMSPIQHLLDVNVKLPLINYAGRGAGFITLKVRTYIDKVEAYPPYISVDREVHADQFLNRMAIIRFHFEGLRQLPQNLSCSPYVFFKFYFHSLAYRTPRYCGTNTNPNIDFTIQIEQKISRDFIEYLRTGCIEFEVFGKRAQSTELMKEAQEATLVSPMVVGEMLRRTDSESESEEEDGADVDLAAESLESEEDVELNAYMGHKAELQRYETQVSELKDKMEELNFESGQRDKKAKKELAMIKKNLEITIHDKEELREQLEEEQSVAEQKMQSQAAQIAELERLLNEAKEETKRLTDSLGSGKSGKWSGKARGLFGGGKSKSPKNASNSPPKTRSPLFGFANIVGTATFAKAANKSPSLSPSGSRESSFRDDQPSRRLSPQNSGSIRQGLDNRFGVPRANSKTLANGTSSDDLNALARESPRRSPRELGSPKKMKSQDKLSSRLSSDKISGSGSPKTKKEKGLGRVSGGASEDGLSSGDLSTGRRAKPTEEKPPVPGDIASELSARAGLGGMLKAVFVSKVNQKSVKSLNGADNYSDHGSNDNFSELDSTRSSARSSGRDKNASGSGRSRQRAASKGTSRENSRSNLQTISQESSVDEIDEASPQGRALALAREKSKRGRDGAGGKKAPAPGPRTKPSVTSTLVSQGPGNPGNPRAAARGVTADSLPEARGR
jgi:hypothetical protein